jgi:hypothetical protein
MNSNNIYIDDFMNTMAMCKHIALKTCIALSLPEEYKKTQITGHCFRVLLPKNDDVKAISCSIPPDVNRRILSGNDIVYETILFGHDDDIIYVDHLGYDDIKRFNTVEEVAEEIVSVYENIKKGKSSGAGAVGDDDL